MFVRLLDQVGCGARTPCCPATARLYYCWPGGAEERVGPGKPEGLSVLSPPRRVCLTPNFVWLLLALSRIGTRRTAAPTAWDRADRPTSCGGAPGVTAVGCCQHSGSKLQYNVPCCRSQLDPRSIYGAEMLYSFCGTGCRILVSLRGYGLASPGIPGPHSSLRSIFAHLQWDPDVAIRPSMHYVRKAERGPCEAARGTPRDCTSS